MALSSVQPFEYVRRSMALRLMFLSAAIVHLACPVCAFVSIPVRAGRFSFNKRDAHKMSLTFSRPVRNEELEKKARDYFSTGNKVIQQLGPTRKEDLEAALADDFEFVAPLVGPLTKSAIVEATEGLDLAAAIPNFDARYHDFRADPEVFCL